MADPVTQQYIVRADKALDEIVPSSPEIEKLAGGHGFTEGPIYLREGYLLYSDIPGNTIFKWTPDGAVTVFRKPSGFTGSGAPAGAFIGSNGLTLDHEGRLLICEHGDHRLTRLERDGTVTVLAESYQGKRLNSPNDVVVKSDGVIYFSDPPYGLVQEDEDPLKELTFNGLYRLKDGVLELLTDELKRPNGLAFSPDERYLYVSNSDPERKIWMRYDVQPDGTIANGRVLYDVTDRTEDGLPDGLKIDKRGNVYCTGPAGIWIFNPDGKLLGRIITPETPANLHWGKYFPLGAPAGEARLAPDEDADTLYFTARTSVYRMRLLVPGLRP